MIFVDLSQTIISVVFQNLKGDFSADLSRAMVFQTLLSYRKKHGNKYGAMVLAYDNRDSKSWRKLKYKWYKANRNAKFEDPKEKEKWDKIFAVANQLIEEFKENLTWKIVGVPGAEADDVIAVLCKTFGDREPTLIISSDGDFPQLQKFKKVVQYSAIQKKFITVDDPVAYLHEKLLRGDSGDGIPNVLSPSNSLVDKIKQKSVTQAIRDEWMTEPLFLQDKYKDRFEENRELIDFEYIPTDIQEKIIQAYTDAPIHGIQTLYKFFIKSRMTRILPEMDMFKVKPESYTNATNIHSDEDFFDGGTF